MSKQDKELVRRLWHAGVDAVGGEPSVRRALQQDTPFEADFIIAAGKAASGMCLGALKSLPQPCPALVITKYGHVDSELSDFDDVEIIESAHPVPDDNSLIAGQRALDVVRQLPDGTKLLLLISGGASALTEALPVDFSLQKLQSLTSEMLAAGKTIAEINAARREISLIKGGKLLREFAGKEARAYIISDVEGDDIDVIASGTGASHQCPVTASSRVIASNQIARNAVQQAAEDLNLEVRHNSESLYSDVYQLASSLTETLRTGAPGIYIWGGEPTIVLPSQPGEGGRNQSLALACGIELQGTENISLIVAGTDGSDGPTEAAGGVIDGQSCLDLTAAKRHLLVADAGPFLRSTGDLVVSGPTNTNVMDLVVAMVR